MATPTAAAFLCRSGGALFFSSSALRRGTFSSMTSSLRSPLLNSHSLVFPFQSLSVPVGRQGRNLFCAPQPEKVTVAEAEASVQTEASPPSPEELVRQAADGLDIRVGRVLKVWRHPEADSLYVEEVDVGELEPRTICSGLVKYVPIEHIEGKDVVVLANLKPRNMRGVKSNGMLMAASDALHENVELLVPPEGCTPGERIWFGSEAEKSRHPDAATPNQVQKKKIWEAVQPHLKTTDTCEAVLLGVHVMRTAAGVVASKSLKNANIS